MLLTIADRTINESKTLEALFDTALLNGVGITDDIAQDVVLLQPDNNYNLVAVLIRTTATLGFTGSRKIKRHQKVTDFATQYAGSMESLFEVALLNGRISITDEQTPGTALLVNPADSEVIAFYEQDNTVDIVTNETGDIIQPGGIGYMQIGTSFIVS